MNSACHEQKAALSYQQAIYCFAQKEIQSRSNCGYEFSLARTALLIGGAGAAAPVELSGFERGSGMDPNDSDVPGMHRDPYACTENLLAATYYESIAEHIKDRRSLCKLNM